MLKLEYLFDNKDLAEMILGNWEHDKDDPDFLKYYRISSNAVYWCKNKGNRFFLRFTPAEEKSRESILGELEFLAYLRDKGYPAVQTILSKEGNELETVNTPWGTYHAAAFKKASGSQLSEMQLTDELIYGAGKALGKLHSLSSEYKPIKNVRNDWRKNMDWMEDALSDFPDEVSAKNELSMLKDYLSKLPCTKENFGLVHYDFETDNVFYDEVTKHYNVIDFDDSMYHWYAMDIEQSLDTITEDMNEEQAKHAASEFIKGYRFEYSVSESMLNLLPVFRRYADLYGYVRITRSMKEKWDNEPEWLVNLRIKLEDALNRKKRNFERPL